MVPERLLGPFEEPAFQSGLLIGVVALGVGAAVGVLWRRQWGRPAPVAGLVLAAAAVVALSGTGRLGDGLAAGLVALAVAGLVADGYPPARPALPLLALPGAWFLATAVEVSQDWAPAAVGVVIVAGGALVAVFDHHDRARALGPALMAVSLAGVFLTVPETVEALPVFAVAVPLVLLAWPLRLANLGAGGSLAATGLLAWTVAQGGTFRDGALVGGLACLGMLVALPVGRALVGRNVEGRRRPWPPTVTAVVVAGAQVVVVALVARVAGLREDAGSATIVASVALALAVVAGAAISMGGAPAARTSTEARQDVS